MTEKELIAKLQELKQIKPNRTWVTLTKNEILSAPQYAQRVLPAKTTAWTNLFGFLFQKKLAYALAALAILVIGSVGVMQLPGNPGVPAISPATLVEVKNSVEAFKVKSKELSMVNQKDPQEFSVAVNSIKIAAKQLTEAIQKNPGVAKEVALEINNNKTYLNVEGSAELKATSDVLYKTIVEQMIKDLGKTSLTESQKEALDIAEDLYKKERYTDALESILLLSMAMQNK